MSLGDLVAELVIDRRGEAQRLERLGVLVGHVARQRAQHEPTGALRRLDVRAWRSARAY